MVHLSLPIRILYYEENLTILRRDEVIFFSGHFLAEKASTPECIATIRCVEIFVYISVKYLQ